jgi:segregation and condensation protein A
MDENEVIADAVSKVGQEQIHGLLFGDTVSWQAIIYDLIHTEQLDPWDVDISLLANKYLDKVRSMEEANFFVSSKVLLAAALLLRIKSEIVLNEYIPTMDEILFGKKEEKPTYVQERIELDEDIPLLVPRTPLPRFRKVSLEELMSALGKAITTETRRIKKVVLSRQQEYETALALPKNRINLLDSITSVYARLEDEFEDREEKLAFSEFAENTKEGKVATFIPLLHLDNQQKVWLEQEGHVKEIWILLKHLYEKQNAGELERMRKEVEADIEAFKEEVEKAHNEKGFEGDDDEDASKKPAVRRKEVAPSDDEDDES